MNEALLNRLKELDAEMAAIREPYKDKPMADEVATQFDAKLDEYRRITADMERESKYQNARKTLETPVNSVVHPTNDSGKDAQEEARGGFKDLGDFIFHARFRQSDGRIQALADKYGSDAGIPVPPAFGAKLRSFRNDQSMGVGAEGGFLAPERHRGPESMLEIAPSEAVIRPRATVLPAGTPPDAAEDIPALDQSGDNGVYAGVKVQWLAEGAAKPKTAAAFRNVRVEPREVAGTIPITDKLLRNAPLVSAILERLFRGSAISAEERAFLRGDGVGKPLGIIGHSATIEQTRVATGNIAYLDIVNMSAKRRIGAGPYAWIVSQTTLPQLKTMNMSGTGSPLVWQPSAREGEPPTLDGFPVHIMEHSPALGSTGDIVLVALSHYLIRDGSGPFVEFGHVGDQFEENKQTVKLTWNVDGLPWLTSPITLEDGTTEVSPFVVLSTTQT